MTMPLAIGSESSSARFAIYWAPPIGSSLDRLGAAWLGRDAGGADVPRLAIPGLDDASWAKLIQAPRLYALHATLKPPFFLADGATEAELKAAIQALAGEVAPFSLPLLRLSLLDGFIALLPSAPSPPLDALAARCVMDLDRFRRPARPEELARRRSAGLTARQDRNLMRWGYPYVLDDFRFHVTLTERVDAETAATLLSSLSGPLSHAVDTTYAVTDIALFVQPDPDAPFHQSSRFRLSAQGG
ncbi:MAG TPA: DUF1045 domain-containing protein [Candidatus Cybelea sp.]|nr:DUF1045 domain-containing protein [Candidatus Cybelea sp.]